MEQIIKDGENIIITNTQTIPVDDFISRKKDEIKMIERQLENNASEKVRLEARKAEIEDVIASYK
jgi:hypothetical protein